MNMQANASLAPNSWEQYVSAIIEYYNVTSGSTQLSNSTAAPGEDPAATVQERMLSQSFKLHGSIVHHPDWNAV